MLKKLLKFLYWLIIIIFLFLCVAVYVYRDEWIKEDSPSTPITQNERLDDPTLLYASLTSSGLCRNDNGEEGGCYWEIYLYTTGKFIEEMGFVPYDGSVKQITPTREWQLTPDMFDIFKKQLNESDVVSKNCPFQMVMDIDWDYYLNLNGKKTRWRNPPMECRDIFNKLDKTLKEMNKCEADTKICANSATVRRTEKDCSFASCPPSPSCTGESCE